MSFDLEKDEAVAIAWLADRTNKKINAKKKVAGLEGIVKAVSKHHKSLLDDSIANKHLSKLCEESGPGCCSEVTEYMDCLVSSSCGSSRSSCSRGFGFGELLEVRLKSNDLGRLVRGCHPFASLHKSLELVACQVHETVHGKSCPIITIALLIFDTDMEHTVSGSEMAFEKIREEVLCSFTASSQLVLSELDKRIKLINVSLDFFQLLGEKREMFSEDSGSSPSVNEAFSDNDLCQESVGGNITTMPMVFPRVCFAESRKRQGSSDEFADLHIVLSSMDWISPTGCDKFLQVFQGEPSMMSCHIQQVGSWIVQVLRDSKVPSAFTALCLEEGKEGLQASRFNAERISRISMKGSAGLTADGKALTSAKVDDAGNGTRNQGKRRRNLSSLSDLRNNRVSHLLSFVTCRLTQVCGDSFKTWEHKCQTGSGNAKAH